MGGKDTVTYWRSGEQLELYHARAPGGRTGAVPHSQGDLRSLCSWQCHSQCVQEAQPRLLHSNPFLRTPSLAGEPETGFHLDLSPPWSCTSHLSQASTSLCLRGLTAGSWQQPLTISRLSASSLAHLDEPFFSPH